MKKRGSYAAVEARNSPFVERIYQLKSDHPFWGYRRIWAHLTYVDGLKISKHRVERLMRQHNLQVKKNMKLKAIRRADTKKPKPTKPNQWWGIDMTKVMIEGFGWVYVVIVIDWHTKKVVGHYAGLQSKAWHWLSALNKAVNRQFPEGARGQDVHLMSDNGCQPTATSFMAACHALGIHQAFTSYNNPKGNADTERFMRTLKEEFAWLREWNSPTIFIEELDKWIEYYNAAYLHSTLSYMPPSIFEQQFLTQNKHQRTPLKYAC